MIETDSYLQFTVNGKILKVGLSKTINNYESTDFTDDMYNVGAYDDIHNVGTFNTEYTQPIKSIVDSPLDICNVVSVPGSDLNLKSYHSENEIKMYTRTLLATFSNGNGLRFQYYKGSTDIKIITELNIQDWYITSNFATNNTETELENIFADKSGYYTWSLVNKHDESVVIENIIILRAVIDKENLCFYNAYIGSPFGANANANVYGSGYIVDDANYFTPYFDNVENDNTKLLYYTINFENTGEIIQYPPTVYTHTTNDKYKFTIGVVAAVAPYYRYYYFNVNAIMFRQILSWAGLYFKFNNTMYKPIIENGIVTGFSDDLNKKSDIDNWNNINGHNIPVSPKPEITDDDDIEPVGYGYFSNTTMGTLYSLYNKLVDLEKIEQWFHTQTDKINIANNVISMKEIPFSLSTLNIIPYETDLKIGGVNVTYNGENVKVGRIVSPVTVNASVLFGEFNIPRLSNTFLDYSPYTKYELLLPFAPTPVTLPDWCINKTVRAIFLYDIYTASCQYVIECNGERICSVSGIFGVDRPISAQNVALKDASRLSAQVATASSVLGGVMSSATGNIGGIVSGAIGGVSALSQMIMSGKQNYMYTVGANGDSSSVGLCHAAHLKITRTLSAEDSNFTHVYGRPLCKYKKLSSVTGYTKCDNVNTNGLSCSENEKQMIKRLLEAGIYI